MNDLILEELENRVNEALNNDEIPVGAVIFNQNNDIIASAANNRQKECNVLGHAEINAIIKAEKKIKDWRLDGYSLVVNLEPCEMCSNIIKETRIDKVYYFVGSNNKSHVKISKEILADDKYREIAEKYKKILSTYFKNKR